MLLYFWMKIIYAHANNLLLYDPDIFWIKRMPKSQCGFTWMTFENQ